VAFRLAGVARNATSAEIEEKLGRFAAVRAMIAAVATAKFAGYIIDKFPENRSSELMLETVSLFLSSIDAVLETKTA
jgi:hypothetical protein